MVALLTNSSIAYNLLIYECLIKKEKTMTTQRAIEVVRQYIDYRNGALKMPDGVELDEALDKAIEVVRESLECQHPYSFVHSRCFGEINQCLLCGEEL